MAPHSGERWVIEDRVQVRPDPDGKFDELMIYDSTGACIVHAEMMDAGCLWIGIYPPNDKGQTAAMWVKAKGRKLEIDVGND